MRRTRACVGEYRVRDPLERPRQTSWVFVGGVFETRAAVFFLFLVGEASLRVPFDVKSRETQEKLVTRAVSTIYSVRAPPVTASNMRKRCLSTASERSAKRSAFGEKWDMDVRVDESSTCGREMAAVDTGCCLLDFELIAENLTEVAERSLQPSRILIPFP